MAFSVGPQAGPTWLITGDAGGAINPFNGEGISYAYETGRLAAEVLDEALVTGNGLALTEYDRRLQETYGAVLQGGPRLRAHHRPARTDAAAWSAPASAARR